MFYSSTIMNNKKILINTLNLVKEFINEASKIDEEVTLIDDKGIEINGKSIIGIFTLNLIKPLHLKTNTEDLKFKNFIKKIEV